MPLPDVKTLIRRVVKVFKKECETKRPIICFAKPMQRVVKTLGISRNQISKVMDSCDASAKSKATCSQSEPKLRPQNTDTVDSFDRYIVKVAALEILRENKTLNLKTLRVYLKEKKNLSLINPWPYHFKSLPLLQRQSKLVAELTVA